MTPPISQAFKVLPAHANPNEDIAIFADHSVFMRSVYLHGRALFEASTDKEKARMSRAAPTFFGDLNSMFVEYTILQVCKITDPAQDFKKNDNHTIAFLTKHYDFSSDPAAAKRLAELDTRIQAFRAKLLPARNKLISHSDRATILAGQSLGGAPQRDWNQFWIDLQEVVEIIYKKVFGTTFHINGVAMLSDADGLLKALKHGECFDELMRTGDSALIHKGADLALAPD